jgi:predicted phosphohydrolase
MDKFGEDWRNHTEKIKSNWMNVITGTDTVLIPGDISWALYLEDALPDLQFIDDLPGKKILFPGNHDYWWTSTNKLNALPLKSMTFLKFGYT